MRSSRGVDPPATGHRQPLHTQRGSDRSGTSSHAGERLSQVTWAATGESQATATPTGPRKLSGPGGSFGGAGNGLACPAARRSDATQNERQGARRCCCSGLHSSQHGCRWAATADAAARHL